MPLPKNVKKQATLADKLHAEIYTKKDLEGTADEATTETTTVDDNKDNAGVIESSVSEPETKPEAPQVEQPAEEVQKQTEPEVAPTSDWEHKYNVINGKYKAEVPRLHQQIRDLNTDMAYLRSDMDKMSAAPVAPVVTTAAATALVTEQEIEEYGSDLVGVIGRASREAMNPEVEQLREEIKTLKNSLNGINEKTTQNDRDRLLSELTAAIPEWELQNNDPLFMDWLSQQDPLSGMHRHRLLDAAFGKNDTARVINFFKGYLTENGMTQPVVQQQGRTAQVDLADSTAPGKSRGSSPAPKGNKRIWAQSDISQFYRDIQRGVYKNKDSEKNALEKDIIAAAQEGRLVA